MTKISKVGGCFTCFLINNCQWSGGCPHIDRSPFNYDQGSMMDQSNLLKNIFGNLLVIQINILETKELYQDKTLPITYQLFVKL